MDPCEKEIRRLQTLCDEVMTDEENEIEVGNEDNDAEMMDIHEMITSNHETDSEQELSDEFVEQKINNEDVRPGSQRYLFYFDKNGEFLWNRLCFPENVRTRQQDLYRKLLSVIGVARNAMSVLETWELFFQILHYKKL